VGGAGQKGLELPIAQESGVNADEHGTWSVRLVRSCVSVRQDPRGIHTWTFHIDNGCPIAQRVKIDLSFRTDSECLTVPAESTADWKGEIGLANQFQGLVAR